MDQKKIDRLIEMEWEMFHSVNEGGPKASCQEDPETFYGMRKAQFSSWDDATVDSYYRDVENAAASGRNLVMEKYIHMMKTTQPEEYRALLPRVVMPSEQARILARKITDKMIEQTRSLHEQYPYVSGAGRPLRSSEDYRGFTSVETYQLGELYTYSLNTLQCLWNHFCRLEAEGKSLARIILEHTVAHYGYDSLEKAEEVNRRHAEIPRIDYSGSGV